MHHIVGSFQLVLGGLGVDGLLKFFASAMGGREFNGPFNFYRPSELYCALITPTAESHKLYPACDAFAEESRTRYELLRFVELNSTVRWRVKNLIRAVAQVRVVERRNSLY